MDWLAPNNRPAKNVEFYQRKALAFLFSAEGKDDLRCLNIPFAQLGFYSPLHFLSLIPEEMCEPYKNDRLFLASSGTVRKGDKVLLLEKETEGIIQSAVFKERRVRKSGEADILLDGHRKTYSEDEVVPYKTHLRQQLGTSLAPEKNYAISEDGILDWEEPTWEPGQEVYYKPEKRWATVLSHEEHMKGKNVVLIKLDETQLKREKTVRIPFRELVADAVPVRIPKVLGDASPRASSSSEHSMQVNVGRMDMSQRNPRIMPRSDVADMNGGDDCMDNSSGGTEIIYAEVLPKRAQRSKDKGPFSFAKSFLRKKPSKNRPVSEYIPHSPEEPPRNGNRNALPYQDAETLKSKSYNNLNAVVSDDDMDPFESANYTNSLRSSARKIIQKQLAKEESLRAGSLKASSNPSASRPHVAEIFTWNNNSNTVPQPNDEMMEDDDMNRPTKPMRSKHLKKPSSMDRPSNNLSTMHQERTVEGIDYSKRYYSYSTTTSQPNGNAYPHVTTQTNGKVSPTTNHMNGNASPATSQMNGNAYSPATTQSNGNVSSPLSAIVQQYIAQSRKAPTFQLNLRSSPLPPMTSSYMTSPQAVRPSETSTTYSTSPHSDRPLVTISPYVTSPLATRQPATSSHPRTSPPTQPAVLSTSHSTTSYSGVPPAAPAYSSSPSPLPTVTSSYSRTSPVSIITRQYSTSPLPPAAETEMSTEHSPPRYNSRPLPALEFLWQMTKSTKPSPLDYKFVPLSSSELVKKQVSTSGANRVLQEPGKNMSANYVVVSPPTKPNETTGISSDSSSHDNDSGRGSYRYTPDIDRSRDKPGCDVIYESSPRNRRHPTLQQSTNDEDVYTTNNPSENTGTINNNLQRRYAKNGALSKPKASKYVTNGEGQHDYDDEYKNKKIPHPFNPANLSNVAGYGKGIQGTANSSFADATLFSLFACSNIFDKHLLFSKPGQVERGLKKDVRTILCDKIVTPLRLQAYCKSENITHLREAMLPLSSKMHSSLMDAEEFLYLLFDSALNIESFIEFSNGSKDYIHQIIARPKDRSKSQTVQFMFETSMGTAGLKLKSTPKPCLFLCMPRCKGRLVYYEAVIPSLQLNITRLLHQGPKQCVCEMAATLECSLCHKKNGDIALDFCDVCRGIADQIHFRLDHSPVLVPKSQRDEILNLHSIICTRGNRYVAFVKASEDRLSPWLFFDPTAGDFPEVTLLEDFGRWLDSLEKQPGSFREFAKLHPLLKRIMTDGHLYVYSKTHVADGKTFSESFAI